MKGRKRHIAVDTLGLLGAVSVHAAHLSESRGARLVVLRLFRHTHRLQKIVVDGGYFPVLIHWVWLLFRCPVEIIKRRESRSFQVLPKRWIVERTFGWLNWQRRLAKDYEHWPATSETCLKISMIHIRLKRLASRQS